MASRTYASVKTTDASTRDRPRQAELRSRRIISITPVVVQEMPIRELVEHMLGVTGKDEARMRELLLRGTLVSGASRFRWADGKPMDRRYSRSAGYLSRSRPRRALRAGAFVRPSCAAGRQAIEIPRGGRVAQAAVPARQFWQALMQAKPAAGGCATRRIPTKSMLTCTRGAGPPRQWSACAPARDLVTYSALRDRVRTEPFTSVEFYVER